MTRAGLQIEALPTAHAERPGLAAFVSLDLERLHSGCHAVLPGVEPFLHIALFSGDLPDLLQGILQRRVDPLDASVD